MKRVVNVVDMVGVVRKALLDQLFPAYPVVERTGNKPELVPVISHASILRVFIIIKRMHTYSLHREAKLRFSAGLTGFEPATSSLTGRRALLAALKSHRDLIVTLMRTVRYPVSG